MAQSHNVDALATLATKIVKAKKKLPPESAGLTLLMSSACQSCMQPSFSLLQQKVNDFASADEEVNFAYP